MPTDIVALFGRVSGVRDFKGLGVTRITIDVPVEAHVAATAMLYDQDVLVTLAPKEMAGSAYGLCTNGAPPPAKDEPKEELKGGPLSELAGQWCREPEFQAWLRLAHKQAWTISSQAHKAPEAIARDIILHECGIKSRKELDHDAGAARLFGIGFRGPYRTHLAREK